MNNDQNNQNSALTQAMQAIQQGTQAAQGGQATPPGGGGEVLSGTFGGGNQGQPQGQQGQNPFYDPNAIGNIIKANLQPTGYQGLGSVNSKDLTNQFSNFLSTLHNHFVQQIRGFNPFGMAGQGQQGQGMSQSQSPQPYSIPQAPQPPVDYGNR